MRFNKLFSMNTCLLCHMPSDYVQDLCLDCETMLPWLGNSCKQCALPLPAESDSSYCGNCLVRSQTKHQGPVQQAQALFIYTTPVDYLIQALKFGHRLSIAQVLGRLMADRIYSDYCQQQSYPDIIMPVPLHPLRLRERGFNQALELARPISKVLKVSLNHTHCKRIRATLPQTGLSAVEREKNLKGAFSIQYPLYKQHVCIVDDVMTTGQTIRALSDILKQQGAARIDTWCCARTVEA